jgi:rhodanese-related sulfurtransferase
MKISKLSFAAVGILLGTSALVVSCGGGNTGARDSEPPQPATLSKSPHDDAGCILPELGSEDERAAPSQPIRPRQNSGSGNAQALHDDAGCILPELDLKADLPDRKRTKLELYLTATKAYDLLKKNSKNILFIDVRTQAEVASLGLPAFADGNVPYLQKKQNLVVLNNDFVPAVEARLKEKGLNKQSTIFLICRQGNRSAKATNALAEAGYKKVYHVTDGVIGWKNSHLPWADDTQ